MKDSFIMSVVLAIVAGISLMVVLSINSTVNDIQYKTETFVTEDSLQTWVKEYDSLKYVGYDNEAVIVKQSMDLQRADQIVRILLTGTKAQKDRVKANYAEGSLYK